MAYQDQKTGKDGGVAQPERRRPQSAGCVSPVADQLQSGPGPSRRDDWLGNVDSRTSILRVPKFTCLLGTMQEAYDTNPASRQACDIIYTRARRPSSPKPSFPAKALYAPAAEGWPSRVEFIDETRRRPGVRLRGTRR
jgi:hypothetical protein